MGESFFLCVFDVCVSWFAVMVCVCGGILGVFEDFLVVMFVPVCEGCVFSIFG